MAISSEAIAIPVGYGQHQGVGKAPDSIDFLFHISGDMSQRVMTVIESLVPALEVYSIDEAFVDLTGISSPEQLARQIRAQVLKQTGIPTGHTDWLTDLKDRIHSAQQRAALAVNRELVLLYWEIGQDILARQAEQGWGAKVIERLAHDLRTAFPDMKGFSRANLMYMRAFAEAWPDAEIVQQAVGQLPWSHNLVLLTRLKDQEQRLAYRHCVTCSWLQLRTEIWNFAGAHARTRAKGLSYPQHFP